MIPLSKFAIKKLNLNEMKLLTGGVKDTLRSCSESTCKDGKADTYYEVTSDDGMVFLHSFIRMSEDDCIREPA